MTSDASAPESDYPGAGKLILIEAAELAEATGETAAIALKARSRGK
ncbi:hypothetical protein [Nocardioides silvaticus]|nr:hypothetical protein [Nocardioides silvaticus]